jgi:hypothetical protein
VRFIYVLSILCLSGLNNSSIYDPTSRLCWLGLSALCLSIMCEYICVCGCPKSASSGRAVYPCHHVWDQDVEKLVYANVQLYRGSSKIKGKSLCLQFSATQYSCAEVLSCVYFRRRLTSLPVLFMFHFSSPS